MPTSIAMSRVWAMPNKDTFSIEPIGLFVKRYLANSHNDTICVAEIYQPKEKQVGLFQ